MLNLSEDFQRFMITIFLVLFGTITLFLSLLIIFIRKQSKIKNHFLLIKSIHEKEILKTKLEIQEETFNKISKEIHDNISLGLTLAKLQVNDFINKNNPPSEILQTTVDLLSKSLIDLNDISKSLDGNALSSYGLISALESEIEVLNKSRIYDVSMEIIGEPVFLSPEKDLILLRIFQEACNNILKHAKANTINCMLIYTGNALEMKIVDNGIGFDTEAALNKKEIRKMSGLKNFKTRADIIGAELEIYSVKNVGTTILIRTPINS